MSYDRIWFARNQNDLIINLKLPNVQQQSVQPQRNDPFGNKSQPIVGGSSVLTINNYFNRQQADIVIGTTGTTNNGQAAYEVLTVKALTQMIQISQHITYSVQAQANPF